MIPYLKDHKVKLCVVIKAQEYIIGELIGFPVVWNTITEEELIRMACLAKEEAERNDCKRDYSGGKLY